ncbi:hypothetical protein VV869_24245 [Photobacterium sp. MCCC 1A19761]|uniref:hypothetical protein n=1 Tax=Photobacterium sp. MCCC 1A19761 TaxID=3115000 RepID=UPI00307F8531
MSSDKFENYTKDLGALVKEYALDSISDFNREKSDFNTGYMMAFHRIVTLMQQQAEVFDIDLKDIGLEELSESDFLTISSSI